MSDLLSSLRRTQHQDATSETPVMRRVMIVRIETNAERAKAMHNWHIVHSFECNSCIILRRGQDISNNYKPIKNLHRTVCFIN